jgi:eukaryotic-like serine/threonine-protein kinase
MALDTSIIGRTLAGRFVITGGIGAGGMAAVYRGLQDAEPREVAIKILSPALARNRTMVRRFQREARLAAQFVHPNVVRIFECGVDGDLQFIVMELLGGIDLFDAVARATRFDEQRAVRIVAQVCDALSAAHRLGIIHRDLKPENIMLLPDASDPVADRVKVLDFGMAKILDEDARGKDPATTLLRRRSRASAPSSARRRTCRQSRAGSSRSISAPTSTRAA